MTATVSRTSAILLAASLLSTSCEEDEGSFAPRRERLEIVSERPRVPHRQPRPFRAVAWEHALVRQDDRTVAIDYWGGNPTCIGADHAEARYGEDEIVITLFLGTWRGVCTLERRLHTVTVRLSEPVDGRPIVDGTLGPHYR